MHRRDFVGVVAAALTLPLRAHATQTPAASRIAWNDVPLVDGRTLRADELRDHVVVVEFWASWCPFCKRQNPVLQRLYDEQRSHGLMVLTFSIDKQPAKARAYLAEHGYTFPVAMAGAGSARWFGRLNGLPELYVVASDGRIAFHEANEMFPEDVMALARYARP